MKNQDSSFPLKPVRFSEDFKKSLTNLGEEWAKSDERPKINITVLTGWWDRIDYWLKSDLPLFIRKISLGRGTEKIFQFNGHNRTIIACDNSPAQWAYSCAVQGKVPTILSVADIRKIPVGMVVHKDATYRQRLSGCKYASMINSSGNAKLAHIKPVAIGYKSITNLTVEKTFEHFRRLMFPGNMFVVPKDYAGIAELPEFIKAIKDYEVSKLHGTPFSGWLAQE